MSIEKVMELEIGNVVPSATNPRKRFDESALKELAETIKLHGVLQPLLVRKRDGEFVHEIIAGERRWRASRIAGRETVPCVVKELSDRDVLEIQYIENLARQDLTALEEAEGFAKLIAEGGYTAETLAEKLGKSRSHIFGRLRLARLVGPAREALEAGKIPQTVADLVSRVPVKWQEEYLKEVLTGGDYDYEQRSEGGNGYVQLPMSFRQAKQLLERDYTGRLEQAPWDQADKKLCKVAGCCVKCPKRTGNMAADSEERAGIKDANVCTDLECFTRKSDLHREKIRAGILAENKSKENVTVLTLEEADAADKRGSEFEDPDGWTIRISSGSWQSFSKAVPKAKCMLYLGVDQRGEVMKLRKTSDMTAELKERGLWWDPPATQKELVPTKNETREEFKAREAKEKAAREKAEREALLREQIAEQAELRGAAAVLEKMTRSEPDKKELCVWQFMAGVLMGLEVDGKILENLKLKADGYGFGIPKGFEKFKVGEARRAVLEMAMSIDGYSRSAFNSELVELGAGLVEVDLKAIGKTVEKEVKEKVAAESKAAGETAKLVTDAPKKKQSLLTSAATKKKAKVKK